MKQISIVIDLGKTIAFDLTSPEVILENIISKNRNMIRKAEKNGIVIEYRNLAPSYLQLYKAPVWGREQGYNRESSFFPLYRA